MGGAAEGLQEAGPTGRNGWAKNHKKIYHEVSRANRPPGKAKRPNNMLGHVMPSLIISTVS